MNKNYFWSHIRFSQEEAVERCYASQEHIISGLEYFAFVIENILTSVRNVNTVNFRHVENYFASSVSQLVAVSDDNGANPMFDNSPMENKSILCYSKLDYNPSTPSINLFPFLIDRNVFVQQIATEIDLYLFLGFFQRRDGPIIFQSGRFLLPAFILCHLKIRKKSGVSMTKI